MFVKIKPNQSGSMTVVVAEKEKGATKYLKTIGTSSNPTDISEYVREGEVYIASRRDHMCPELDFEGTRRRTAETELKATEEFLSRIENVIHNAPKRILDRVFDAVGLHAVGNDIFRNLIIAFLSNLEVFLTKQQQLIEPFLRKNSRGRKLRLKINNL